MTKLKRVSLLQLSISIVVDCGVINLSNILSFRLARIKAEARRKREEREQAELMKKLEKQRREDTLREQFFEWDIGLYPDGRVELALVCFPPFIFLIS